MISRLLGRMAYTLVPSTEHECTASHEKNDLQQERNRSSPSLSALAIGALIIATLFGMTGLGIGIWMGVGKGKQPDWTESLSRGR